MSNEKSFDKYFIEIDRNTGEIIINEDGSPKLGEIAKKDCRLDQRYADILNKGWKKSKVIFIESKEQAKKDAKKEQTDKLKAIADKEAEREQMKKELLEEIKAEQSQNDKDKSKDSDDDDLSKLPKDDLIKMCIEKELPTEGNKRELIERLTNKEEN